MKSVDFATERSLVERLRARSPEAFEELTAQYTRRLYSVSFRLLRNRQDAEDAVQDTFLKVFQSIDTFREDSALYTWLFRIVWNEAMARLRLRSRPHPVVPIETYLPRFEEGQHAEDVAEWGRRPDDVLSTQELSEFFERCIDELPEEFRIAYVLKDVEKLPETEVCEILGVPSTTFKNRAHRARLVIRKRVEERFFGRGRAKAPKRRRIS